jgi:hypothetical protein
MNKILKNSKKIPLIIIFFLLFPNFAMAQECTCDWWNLWCWVNCAGETILKAILNVLGYIGTLIFRIPAFLFALLGFALALLATGLGWLIVPPFVNALLELSLKTSYYQQFFGTWTIVRYFALSLVRIFLLIIGLATIFRIAEYHGRKTLISLIVAALLVSLSFSIGMKLIEWGNAFTDYISKTLSVGVEGKYIGINVTEIYQRLFNALLEHFGNIWKIFTTDGDPSALQKTIIIISLISISYWVFAFMSIYTSFVLLALGIVFLLRMIYLICLLVVSPIAFLTAGLRTKEIRQIFGGFLNWDGWWPAFLEWVFIGVVLLVWLKVGILLLDALKEQSIAAAVPECSVEYSEINEACNEEVKFINEHLLSFLPVFAFAVALHIGVKTSPGIVKQAVAGVITTAGLITTAAVAAGTAAITAGVSAAAGGAGVLGSLGAALTHGAGTFAGRLAKGVPEMKKVLPEGFKPGLETLEAGAEEFEKRVGLGRRIRRPLIYEREEARKEVEKTFEEEGPTGVQRLAESRTTGRVVASEAVKFAFEKGIDRGGEWARDDRMRGLMFQVYEEAARRGDRKTTDMIERRLIRNLQENRELRENFERIAERHRIYDRATEGDFIERIIKRVRTADDIKQLQGRWWENTAVMEMAEKFWTGHQWGAAAREFGKELVDALEPLIYGLEIVRDTNNVEAYLHFVWDRPGFASFSETSAAQEVGFPSLYEFAPEAVKSRYKNMREILAAKPPLPPRRGR